MTQCWILPVGLAGIGPLFAASACEGLASLSLTNTAIQAALSVPAGPFTAPDGTAFPSLPAFCRVAGSIQPTTDSDIQFEVWMPTSGEPITAASADRSITAKWAVRFRHGYAAASTDTGHHAGSLGVLDASWAFGASGEAGPGWCRWPSFGQTFQSEKKARQKNRLK